jgi:hypothetical protein
MASFLNADTSPSIYKQYKVDTEPVAGWLAQESSKGGYKLRIVHEQAEAQDVAAPRLKGKARKLVRICTCNTDEHPLLTGIDNRPEKQRKRDQ